MDLVRRTDPTQVQCTILCFGLDVYRERLSDRSDINIVVSKPIMHCSFLKYWSAFVRLNPDVIVFDKGSIDSYPLFAYVAAKLSAAQRLFAIEHLVADPLPPKVTGSGVLNVLRRPFGWRSRFIALHVWDKRLASLILNKTICVSNGVRHALIKEYGFSAADTLTVLNGVDLQRFSSSSAGESIPACRKKLSNDGEVVLLCVSRMVPRKRIDLLLDAFATVHEKFPHCRCVIVGRGPAETDLRAKCEKLGLDSSVTFAGFTEDVRPYLESGDIYISASQKEGLPLGVIEAMAHALPCIVTDIQGHNEVVSHESTGLLVPPGSAEKLAQAISRLVASEEERSRMGINSRRRVEEFFDLENTMTKLKSILLEAA